MQCCEHLIKIGLEEKEKRDKELAAFYKSHREACVQNQQLSVERIQQFEAVKLKVRNTNLKKDIHKKNCWYFLPCLHHLATTRYNIRKYK